MVGTMGGTPPQRRRLKFIGLFSGGGFFEYAMLAMGHILMALCEMDSKAVLVLEDKFGYEVPIWGNILGVTSLLAGCELLVAGFPCTDVSPQGRRKGMDGLHTSLVKQIIRLLEEAKKAEGGRLVDYVLLENVEGLLNCVGGKEPVIEYVIRELVRLGYKSWAYRVIDASAWGTPNPRVRVFLLASTKLDAATVLLSQGQQVCGGECKGPGGDGPCYKHYQPHPASHVIVADLGEGRHLAPQDKVVTLRCTNTRQCMLSTDGRSGMLSIKAKEELMMAPADYTKVEGLTAAQRNVILGNAVNYAPALWLADCMAYPSRYLYQRTSKDRLLAKAGVQWSWKEGVTLDRSGYWTEEVGRRGVPDMSPAPVHRPYRPVTPDVDIDRAPTVLELFGYMWRLVEHEKDVCTLVHMFKTCKVAVSKAELLAMAGGGKTFAERKTAVRRAKERVDCGQCGHCTATTPLERQDCCPVWRAGVMSAAGHPGAVLAIRKVLALGACVSVWGDAAWRRGCLVSYSSKTMSHGVHFTDSEEPEEVQLWSPSERVRQDRPPGTWYAPKAVLGAVLQAKADAALFIKRAQAEEARHQARVLQLEEARDKEAAARDTARRLRAAALKERIQRQGEERGDRQKKRAGATMEAARNKAQRIAAGREVEAAVVLGPPPPALSPPAPPSDPLPAPAAPVLAPAGAWLPAECGVGAQCLVEGVAVTADGSPACPTLPLHAALATQRPADAKPRAQHSTGAKAPSCAGSPQHARQPAQESHGAQDGLLQDESTPAQFRLVSPLTAPLLVHPVPAATAVTPALSRPAPGRVMQGLDGGRQYPILHWRPADHASQHWRPADYASQRPPLRKPDPRPPSPPKVCDRENCEEPRRRYRTICDTHHREEVSERNRLRGRPLGFEVPR